MERYESWTSTHSTTIAREALRLLYKHHVVSRDPHFIDALARLFYSLDTKGEPKNK